MSENKPEPGLTKSEAQQLLAVLSEVPIKFGIPAYQFVMRCLQVRELEAKKESDHADVSAPKAS